MNLNFLFFKLEIIFSQWSLCIIEKAKTEHYLSHDAWHENQIMLSLIHPMQGCKNLLDNTHRKVSCSVDVNGPVLFLAFWTVVTALFHIWLRSVYQWLLLLSCILPPGTTESKLLCISHASPYGLIISGSTAVLSAVLTSWWQLQPNLWSSSLACLLPSSVVISSLCCREMGEVRSSFFLIPRRMVLRKVFWGHTWNLVSVF